jgi:hypothetical protein
MVETNGVKGESSAYVPHYRTDNIEQNRSIDPRHMQENLIAGPVRCSEFLTTGFGGGSSWFLLLSLLWGIWRNSMQNGGKNFSVAHPGLGGREFLEYLTDR